MVRASILHPNTYTSLHLTHISHPLALLSHTNRVMPIFYTSWITMERTMHECVKELAPGVVLIQIEHRHS